MYWELSKHEQKKFDGVVAEALNVRELFGIAKTTLGIFAIPNDLLTFFVGILMETKHFMREIVSVEESLKQRNLNLEALLYRCLSDNWKSEKKR